MVNGVHLGPKIFIVYFFKFLFESPRLRNSTTMCDQHRKYISKHIGVCHSDAAIQKLSQGTVNGIIKADTITRREQKQFIPEFKMAMSGNVDAKSLPWTREKPDQGSRNKQHLNGDKKFFICHSSFRSLGLV